MRRKIKVYIETSVISAFFDERNPERKWFTQLFFDNINNFEPYISDLVFMEIDRTTNIILQEKMTKIASRLPSLSLRDDIEWLASEYIRYDAIPEGYPEDAYHIAVATTHEMDCLVSWNFKHIVRRKTKEIVRMVNIINGLREIEILTPAELL